MRREDFVNPARVIAHRPWAMPSRAWVMTQRWSDLLFAHWPVATDALRSLVPSALELDRFHETAWLTLAAFSLSHLRLRGVPTLPFGADFLELNVRTYVSVGGKPGVYFFSLDAESMLAVLGARALFDLPYFHARMRLARRDNATLEYESHRLRGDRADFLATYAPHGPVSPAEHGSLDHFLAERYCLYTADARGRVYRTDIHHAPWPLQPATATIHKNTMAQAAGITIPEVAPRVAFAERIDVLVWPRERIV